MVDLASLQALLAEAPELPQAEQLARMAVTRGATAVPAVFPSRRLVDLGSPPARYRARPVQGDLAADQLRAALEPYVDANDAAGAEALRGIRSIEVLAKADGSHLALFPDQWRAKTVTRDHPDVLIEALPASTG